MSNFQQYNGPGQRVYTSYDLTVSPLDIIDFGVLTVPTDGFWTSHAGPATHGFDNTTVTGPTSSASIPFYSTGIPLAPVMYKLQTGQPVAITFLGDSVLEGTTVTVGGGTLGTDDAISLIRSTLAANWPNATVTVQNRAHSGTTQLVETRREWANALADNADVYVISGGKNDIAAYTVGLPGSLQGQTYASSHALIESKIAELRQVKPDSAIVLMTENPYSAASTAANTYLANWNAGLARLADAYQCEFVDGYGAFTARGSWDGLLSDGVHPNGAAGGSINEVSGHALLAQAFMAHFPASFTAQASTATELRLEPPGKTRLYNPWKYSRLGVVAMTAAAAVAYAPKLSKVGSWTGSGPWTTSTAGDFMIATINGAEAFLDMVLGSGQGTVDILVDGTPVYTSFDLSNVALNNGKLLQMPALGLGWHYIVIKVISGSVTYNGIVFPQGRAQFLNKDSASIVNASMGTPGAGVSSSPGDGTYIPSAIAGTQTVTFVGTGIAIHSWRSAGGGGTGFFTSATLDGVALTSPIPINGSSDYQYIRHQLASGLAYGKHTLVLTWSATGINVTGFDVFDETPTLRPAQLQGWAGAAEVVKYGQAFPQAPLVTAKDSSAGLAAFTSQSATGFTMGAVAGWWVASAVDDSAGNRLLY